MTAPIQFPSISPPQVVRSESPFGDLAQLLVAVTQGRQQLAVRKQELALEKERTAASVAEAGQRTASDKADQKRKEREFELKEMGIQAEEIVANELPGILTAPGDFAENAEAARVKLIQGDKKLAPFINAAFNKALKEATDARAAIAQRRTAEATANVAEATQAADISKGITDAERAKVELATAKVNETLARDVAKFGQRGGLMAQYMTQGATAGDAARLSGMPLPAGVPPDYKLPGTGSAASAQNDVLLANMELANTAINSTKNPGLKPAAWTQLTKATIMGIPSALLTDPLMSDEQKQLVSAYSSLILPLNKLMSGARASDLDLTTARQTIVTRDADGQKTRAQKALLRQLLPVVFAAQETGAGIAGPMQQILDAAKASGVPDAMLAPYRRVQKRYSDLEGKKSRNTGREGLQDAVMREEFGTGRRP